MPITAIRTAPVKEDYTSLEEHQSRTPETFFGGRPILHAHVQGASAWLQRSGRAARGLSAMFPNAGPCGAGQGQQQPEHVLRAQRVDVFVGSDFLALFNEALNSGIQVPYPMIALHATKSVSLSSAQDGAAGDMHTEPAVCMQLLVSPEHDQDEFGMAELTLIPPPAETKPAAAPTVTAAHLFAAISDCSNLHPDPVQEGSNYDDDDDDDDYYYYNSDDGGLPPPVPGSGGWITAENVDEYFDGDGNFIAGHGAKHDDEGELGDGAGRVRPRDEVDMGEGANGVSDHGGGAESKRPRVE